MKALIEHGADVNSLDSKMGVSVLHKAVYSGNEVAVQYLLTHGALVNLISFSNGDTPLHDAIYFRRKKSGLGVIHTLLAAGASLSIRNRAGLTPIESAHLLHDQAAENELLQEQAQRFSERGRELMAAVRKGDADQVQRLLAISGVPIQEADEQGFTPLLWAAREGMAQITKMLLEHGADPNRLDAWMGANAGHKAAFWGRANVMPLLIEHHLDLNARGVYNGYTPLHDAVSGGHFEVARILVQAGARTDIRGHDGKTVEDIARDNDDEKIMKLLEGQRSKK